MDRYDEKADDLFEGRDLVRPGQRQGPSVSEVAAFGRECAREARAKAFEEAADICYEMDRPVFLELAAKARANPPAPCAGCGGTLTVFVGSFGKPDAKVAPCPKCAPRSPEAP